MNKLKSDIDLIAARKGYTLDQREWLNKKLSTFDATSVNIDKDNLLARILADIFGEPISLAKKYGKSLLTP